MYPPELSHAMKPLYIGLDVHKEKTSVAIARPGANGEITYHGSIATSLITLERSLRRIAKSHNRTMQDLRVTYEAGGCGMWIARRLAQLKVPCLVAAPSLIARPPGDPVKTDRKDAEMLARLLRSGDLTAVRVPDETDEAIRDLCRARVDAIDDLRRTRTRLLGMLRRLGHNYNGRTHWTQKHRNYLRELSLPFAAHRVILEEQLMQIDQHEERIARIEQNMLGLLDAWRHKDLVAALMGFKGFKHIAAMVIVPEIGDFTRFAHPRKLVKYLGLNCREYSTGSREIKMGITKCGNPHARWILVEEAVHYKPAPKVSRQLGNRQQGLPRWVKELSWKAQNRLHHRFKALASRRMQHNKIKVAVARELAMFIWELGVRMQSLETPQPTNA